MTNPAMLTWQWREILFEVGELQAHGSDPTCPCTLADSGEYCLPKHALRLNGLARETRPMAGAAHAEMLEKLAEESLDYHNKLKDRINCGKAHKDEGDVVQWARDWRKIVEPIYYACPLRQKRGPKMELHQEPTEISLSARGAKPVCALLQASFFLPKARMIADIVSANNFLRGQQTVEEDAQDIKKLVPLRAPALELKWREGRNMQFSAQWATERLVARLLGVKSLAPGVALSAMATPKPVCGPEQKAKLERCVLKVKARNTAASCPPQGTGAKGCPVPQAVCQKSIGCRPGQAAELKVAPSTAKEPWQMTQKEYVRFLKRTLTPEQLREHPKAIIAAPSMHRKRVETALEYGKPVPPKVLADYPNLVPHKKAQLHAVEHALTICEGPRGITIGSQAQGSKEKVFITPSCPAGLKPIALFHTHPEGLPELSEKDKVAMRQLNIPVCVGVPGKGKVSCERP